VQSIALQEPTVYPIRAEPQQGAAQSAERLGVARQSGNVVLQQW